MSLEQPIDSPDEIVQRSRKEPEADRWARAYARVRDNAEYVKQMQQQRMEMETAQIQRTYRERARMAALKFRHSHGRCSEIELMELRQLLDKYAR